MRSKAFKLHISLGNLCSHLARKPNRWKWSCFDYAAARAPWRTDFETHSTPQQAVWFALHAGQTWGPVGFLNISTKTTLSGLFLAYLVTIFEAWLKEIQILPCISPHVCICVCIYVCACARARAHTHTHTHSEPSLCYTLKRITRALRYIKCPELFLSDQLILPFRCQGRSLNNNWNMFNDLG